LIRGWRVGERRFINRPVAVIVDAVADFNGRSNAALASQCAVCTNHYARSAWRLSRAAGDTGPNGLLVHHSVAIIVDTVAELRRWADKTRALPASLVTALALALWKRVIVDKVSGRTTRYARYRCDVIHLSIAIIVYAVTYLVAGWRRRHAGPRP